MGTIPYNLDIPDGPNDPSVDEPKMKENTNSINQIIGKDHFSFGSSLVPPGVGPDGWHKQSTYPRFSLVPAAGPPTLPFQGAVYTKDVGGGIIQLFYRRENNGPEIQLTTAGMLTNTPQAFVNFDGTVPIVAGNEPQIIRGSFNVTSVTRIAKNIGKYQINFTNPLPSANYVVVFGAQISGVGNRFVYGAILDVAYTTAVTTTTLQIAFTKDGTNGGLNDVFMGNVAVFGG